MKILRLCSILYLFLCVSINAWSFQNFNDSSIAEFETLNKKITPVNNVNIDVSGNLMYTDVIGIDDKISIVLEGSYYRVSNTTAVLVAGTGMKQDKNDVLVPVALVTGQININTQAGDDTFTVDFSKGNIKVPVYYNGGSQNTSSGDDMVLVSSDIIIYDKVEHTFINDHDGYVDVSDNSTINYTGLEPITDNLNTSDRVFTFTGNQGNIESIALEAGGTLDNRIDSDYGESVDFNNPLNSLTINLTGAGDDLLSVRSLASGFNADLIINGDTGDNVGFRNNAIDLGTGNLAITCDLLSIYQNITTTGTITTSSKNTTHIISATVQSNGGNISISSGTEVVSGDFGVINMFGGHVKATGSGTITMNGRAYATRNINFVLSSIFMRSGSSVTTDTGMLEMTGSGIFDGRANIRGIRIEGNSSIQSTTGNVTITGTGMNGANNDNVGVSLASGTIQTGGTVNVTGSGYIGVQLDGIVRDSGNMSLQGTSGSTNAPAITITSSTAKIESNNLLISANVGPINTPNGVAVQELIEANNTTVNGVLAPGQSPGQLIANTNLTVGLGSTVEIEFEGQLTAGSDYDQIVVRGAIDITGTTFNLVDNADAIFSENYTIIDNDGVDPIIGTFNGLPNGTAIVGNGRTWTIHYNGGDGNDVVLVTEPDEPNVYLDNSGNLVFEDPDNVNDTITIIVDGTNYRISDSGKKLIAGLGTTQDGNDALVPITSVTGQININTGSGNDNFTINLTGGNFSDEINYDGGDNNDTLALEGNGSYDQVSYFFYNSSSVVNISGNSTIVYQGLESSVLDQLTARTRVFDINNINDIILNNAPSILEYQIGTTLSGWVDFNFSEAVLAIYTNNSASINYFGTEGNVNLVMGTPLEPVDTVSINADMDLGELNLVSKKLNIYQSVTTKNSVSAFVSGRVFIENGIVQSTLGDVDIYGGRSIPEDKGIHLTGTAEIKTTSGNIRLEGTALENGSFTNAMGIRLENSTRIYSQTGNITLNGATNSIYDESYGIHLANESYIESNGGDIRITGISNTSNNEDSGRHIGVYLVNTALIKTTNAGKVEITGTGGRSDVLGGNHGIVAHGGTTITAENGNVAITGKGTHRDSDGIQVRGAITTTGTGNVIIEGEATSFATNTSINVIPSAQITSGGEITLNATTMPIKTAGGIPSQTQFVANNTIINGVLTPGQSPGQMVVDGNFEINTGDVLRLEINDFTNPGNNFDQLKINGQVTINDATLELVDTSGEFPVDDVVITIIDNDGTDPIIGTFNGLPNGASIMTNGKSWYLHYNKGDGNDVVLSSLATIVDVVVEDGDMIFTDYGSQNDNLTIVVDNVNYRISDSGRALVAGQGATQDGNHVLVPIASVTKAIHLNTRRGNDNIHIDLNGGDFVDEIFYNAGNDTDGLSLLGAATYNNVVHTLDNPGEGKVRITGNSMINYTGIEGSIIDQLDVNERTFTINANTTTRLKTDGTLENQVAIRGYFEIDYNNPNNVLTINGTGGPNGFIQVNGFATGFDAHLVIIKEEDIVRFGPNTNINLGSGILRVIARSVLFRTEVTTQGAIEVISHEGTSFSEANIVSSAGEDININAGLFPNPGLSTYGIDMIESTLRTTSEGNITLSGKAFSDDPSISTRGITMVRSNILTDTGNITITGKGPTMGVNQCKGVIIGLESVIQSNSGNINITGTGGECSGGVNVGVSLVIDMMIKTSGSGHINIDGNSGLTGDYNYGIEMMGTSSITAENGEVIFMGNSTATTGTGHIGVWLEGAVSTTGTGNITVNGRVNSSDNTIGIFLPERDTQIQSGANLHLYAVSGPIYTPDAPTRQALFSANNIFINGVLEPGRSAGQVMINGVLEANVGTTLEIEINDFTTPGVDYDQVIVNGTVNLQDAILTIKDNSGSVSSPQNIILINNDGDDLITGNFFRLPHGTAIPGNQKTWYIYYNLNGNDVLLSTSPPNVHVDGSGNLVFSDPYAVNDNLKINIDGENYRISDSGKPVIAGLGATQDGDEVLVAIASVTGDININTGDGDDVLNIDLGNGNFTDAVNFEGGNDDDGLSVSGTGIHDSNVHTVSSAGEGTIAITGNNTISYTGLEQTITDHLDVNERTFTINVNNFTILEAVGALENQVRISDIATIDYNNPNTALTINGAGSDVGYVYINGFATGFDANLTVVREEDQVRFGDMINTDLGSGALNVTSKIVIFRTDVTTEGPINITSDEAIHMSGSVVQSTAGEDIIMKAGVAPQPGRGFDGLEAFECTIQTFGAGNIILDGKAYTENTSTFLEGMTLFETNIITDTGDITISGTGPATGPLKSTGIQVLFSSEIQSNSGNISVTGIGGNSIGASNIGVLVESSAVRTADTGTITINGTGGMGTEFNYGVDIKNNATILAYGNIAITGTSLDTTGNDPFGINFNASATTLAGTGNIILEGTSGNANASAINISHAGTELQSGGDLVMTANLGPIHTTDGVTGVQTNFVAENDIIINGVLAPGQSIGQMITLGNLTMQSDDTLEIAINDVTTAGTDYDQLKVTEGTININGATLTIIDNSPAINSPATIVIIDGEEPVVGTFNGLPQGTAIAGNSNTWYIYYNQGDGYDVILSSEMFMPNVFLDPSGNMLFVDLYQGNDQLTIRVDGTNYRISDQAKGLIAGARAVQDGKDVLVPIASVTGTININTGEGNDHLNINLDGGDFADEIIYDGGDQTDGMSLSGSNMYTSLTHTLTGDNEEEGTIAITNNNIITYRSIEQTIADPLDVNDRVFELDLDDAIVFDSLGALDNQLDIFRGMVIDYKNPSNSLTINSIGEGRNILMIRGVGDGFDADITVNASERDDVRFDSNKVIDIGNGEFNLNSGTLLFGSNSTVRTTGSIMVNTKSVTSILGRVHSNGGNISIAGGTELTSQDNYSGIFLYSCHIETTGDGAITLDGTAYFNTATDIVLDGILMRRNSRIVTDNGDITLIGKGIDNGLVNYRGIYIEESSRIESNRGHITITGTARDHEDDANIGFWLDEGTRIQTGKAVTLDITGEGQIGIKLGGLISTGSVTLTGTSRSADSPAINIETSTAKVQGIKDITLTANVGPIYTPAGVATQPQLDAISGTSTISGILTPGQSAGSETGQLIAEGDVTLQSDATLEVDMNNFGNAGEDYDQLIVNGGFVNINDATLVLKDDTGMLLPDQIVTIVLIDNDGIHDKVRGTFKDLPNGAAIPGNNKTWYIYYNNGDGNDVILSSEKIEVRLHPRVYLQGAGINPNADAVTLMRDDLRIEGYVPTTSPYNDEVTIDASVLATEGSDAIVDWVWVELRDKDDQNKVIHGLSALVQRDGDVVDVDGVADLDFPGLTTNDFYIAITHRNHLGVISAISHTLSETTTIVDFTQNTESAQGGNQALTEVSNGIFGLFAGDVDANATIEDTDANGLIPLLGEAGYHNSDIDANGQVQNTDLHNLVYPNLGYNQQFSNIAGKNIQIPSVHFTFANAKITQDGDTSFYEADIMIESTEAFKLGSGQLYIDYSQTAFGENIVANQKIEYSQPEGSILAENYGAPAYQDFMQNDNTNTRISLSFQQGVGVGVITANNVTATPRVLFHIRIPYIDVKQNPQLCFVSDEVFRHQFFTACGSGVAGAIDCTNNRGVQLLNDTFDCSGAIPEEEPEEEPEVTIIGVKMYPNPTTDIFYIKGLVEKSTIYIYDVYGRLVFRNDTYLDDPINITHLEAALYWVYVTNSKEEYSMSLIKK